MLDGTETNAPAPPGDDSARTVFLAWERLRLLYNAILAIVVLAGAGPDLTDGMFPWALALAVFYANLCFCLGPVVEGYLVLFFRAERLAVRWLVFVPGVLLACGLAVAWLTQWRLQVPD